MSAASREPETSTHLTVRRVRFVAAALAAHLNLLFDEGVSWDEAEGQRFLTDPSNLLVVAF